MLSRYLGQTESVIDKKMPADYGIKTLCKSKSYLKVLRRVKKSLDVFSYFSGLLRLYELSQ